MKTKRKDIKKTKKKNSKDRIRFDKPFILIILAVLIIIAVSIILYSRTDAARESKAKRIARNYLYQKYGVTFDDADISEGFLYGADYTVYFNLSETNVVLAGVVLKTKKVVYENYVKAEICERMNQDYIEKIVSIWDRQAEVHFDTDFYFEEDKYLLEDKKIDYEGAKRDAALELYISTNGFKLEQSSGAIYNTLSYLKENGVNLKTIRFNDYSSGDYDLYMHYVLTDLDQFESADMILDYLKNYKE